MFLFSRLSTIAPGKFGEAQEFIADITAFVNENAPFEVNVWSVLFGQPLGTVGWSMTFEDLGEYLDASAELNASAEYMAKVSAAADIFVGPAQDALREVVHVAGDAPGAPAYVASTSAVINGNYSKAFEWSVGMAELAHATTGHATMLLRNSFGDFGGVQWLVGYPDSAAVAAANAAVGSSEEYLGRLDAAGDLFVPGSGQQALLRRML